LQSFPILVLRPLATGAAGDRQGHPQVSRHLLARLSPGRWSGTSWAALRPLALDRRRAEDVEEQAQRGGSRPGSPAVHHGRPEILPTAGGRGPQRWQ